MTQSLPRKGFIFAFGALCGAWLSSCAAGASQSSNAASAGRAGSDGSAASAASAGAGAFDAFAACSKAVLEQDRGDDTALSGPGVDADTGQLASGSYVIATTYLALKPDQISAALAFGKPIVQSLASMHGFVAVSLTQSDACATLRTLTVWQTEEDMLAFVMSPSHVAAMAQISVLSRGSSNTVAWQASEAEASWQQAAVHLGQETTGDR